MPMTPRLYFRDADSADLPVLVAMLADDALGRTREVGKAQGDESVVTPAYRSAFEDITRDPNNRLILAVPDLSPEAPVIAMLQLTLMPSLTYQGGRRAQIEGVRVRRDWRRRGVGRMLCDHAIALARQNDCVLVQLTTDRRRPEAHRFYEEIGFVSSHWGMKLSLREP